MRYLYLITNLLNNKVYVGQSYSETERWRQHKYAARSKPRQYIDCAMKKYGISNFTYEVIANSLTQDDGDFIEIELIKQFNSQDRMLGYNISPGGDKVWNKGLQKEKHPMFGKHHSEETKMKMANSRIGIILGPHSKETKKKISDANKGKVRSIECLQKLSKAKLGKKRGDMLIEIKQKISQSNIGKIRTEESKRKQSESRLGFSVSEDTKKKISYSLRGENGPSSKLSNVQAIEIINKKQSGISAVLLAKEYGVSKKTIHCIIKKGLSYYENK